MTKPSFDLSSVPKDWSVFRCGSFFSEQSIKNTKGETNLSVYRDYGVIRTDSRDDNHNRISEDITNYKLVKPGNLVLNKMKGWQGSLGISELRGIVSPSYTVMKPIKVIHNKYFHYLLRSETYRQIYDSLSHGVRIGQWELRYHDFKKISLLYPPLEEQKTISNYLDKKTEQIDSIIEKIKKNIELLKEQLTSLINVCVTRGLNSSVVLRDSEIQWIGKIPKNWKTIPNKYIFLEYFGGSWGLDPEDNQKENLVRVIRVTEFNMETLCISANIPTIRSLKLEKNSKKYIKKNDLILEKSGGGEKTPVGRVVLVDKVLPYSTINSNFTNICRPNLNIVHPRFVVFSLCSKYNDGQTKRNIKQTTGIQNLDLDGFMSEIFVLPPIDEQIKISDYLDNKQNKTNDKIAKLDLKMKLLKEYRQSLISSLVLGKFRLTEKII